MKVLQGTIHQGNNFIFPVYYGVQCCSASVVACAYGLIHEPNLWTARDIDACVHLGTNLHAKSCPQNHNGFLFPHEIHETFTLPNNVDVYLQAAKEAKFIGPIHNIEGFGNEIVSALTTYFQTSRCGILTCNEYSFAILSADDKYWIFDSHAKNMEGKCDSEGFAVLISFSCINELVLYLQQNFNNFSTYSITEIKFDMQIPVFDLLGDSNQNQPGLPVSNHIGDSNQNQPGLCVFDHLGDSNQNQPGLPVFDHLGDSNQNQPGLSVSNHIGDSNQNRPGFTWPLGGSSQNQPGSDVEKDSLKNQPHLLTCPLGDSIQNHPGTDYKQDSKKNLPNSFTGPIGDSSLSQPNTMSHEPQPKIQLTSSKSQPEKTINLHPTHLKSMQISKNMNKKRKMQIKLENSRMEKAKRTRLDINDTLANETVQESKESSPVKLQSKKQEAFRKYYNDKLKNDQEFKKNNLERVKSKLANDKDYKLKNLENVKTRLNDESSRLKNLENVKTRLKNDEDYRLRNLENVKTRLKNDEDYRLRNLENVKTRLKNDDYRLRILENVKSRLEVDVIYQKSTSFAKKKYEEKLKCNTEKYSEKLENNKKHKHNKENDSFEDSKQKVIDQYFIEIKEGPTWICSCCGHLNFKKSMSLLNEFPEDSLFQLKTICTANVPTDNKYMVCHTCRRYLISQTVPNNAVVNGLSFPPIPEVLQGLTQLEERLLAVRQPFMKIIELSKYAGPQYGLKGSCVNVPTDLNSTVSILPRNLTDSETILIKLQRRMEDKVPYSFDLIRPERVYKAAEYLVGTEIYKKHKITLDSDWLHNVQSPVEVITVNNEDNLTENLNILENSLTNSIDENIQTTNSQPNLPHIKPIQKPKHKKFEDIFFDTDSNASSSSNELSDSETETGNHETMVMPDILPDHITNDLGLKIAPGEGQVPISLLQDEDVDILTYPSIYCGKARHFQHKLTDSQLRKFELKSSDRRAAKHIPKLFMSFCKSRLRRFVNRISIAMRKKKNGKSLTAAQILQPNGLDQLIQEDEGYKILDEDRSSPAYWCQKTKEAMAMIRQYGPAHIFATLTSAEVYWHELITILIKINNEQELTEEEVKLLPKLEKINLVKQDPVTCAWTFQKL
ncbi:putative GPI-anchored adhesin-like protein PGA18 [Frankliniella fusca]|uniref:GPI-anchored adhesin-like protein PGA18 n=1 Tax=Frankliniella fusca TaxID=407009 RepID=A0AAE1L7W5_9NEOP|nr:putative GPI-anchored adhesin-like protein PGA18 [Frankliniella fusca]